MLQIGLIFKLNKHTFINSYGDSQHSKTQVLITFMSKHGQFAQESTDIIPVICLCVFQCSAAGQHLMISHAFSSSSLLLPVLACMRLFLASPFPPLPLSDSSRLSLSPLTTGLEYPKRELRSFNVILSSLTARQDKESSQQAAQGMGLRIGRDCKDSLYVCAHLCVSIEFTESVFCQPDCWLTALNTKNKIYKLYFIYCVCHISLKKICHFNFVGF